MVTLKNSKLLQIGFETAKKSRGWLQFRRKFDRKHRSDEIYVWKKISAPRGFKKNGFEKFFAPAGVGGMAEPKNPPHPLRMLGVWRPRCSSCTRCALGVAKDVPPFHRPRPKDNIQFYHWPFWPPKWRSWPPKSPQDALLTPFLASKTHFLAFETLFFRFIGLQLRFFIDFGSILMAQTIENINFS